MPKATPEVRRLLREVGIKDLYDTDSERIAAAAGSAGDLRRELEYLQAQIDKLVVIKNEAWRKVKR